MQRTPLYLLAAAVLSLLAVVGRPGPVQAGAIPVPVTVPQGLQGQGVTVSLASSHGTALAGAEQFVEVNVAAAQDLVVAKAEAVSMVIVVDRSGSMSGVKISQARAAAHRLIEAMRETDELAMVSFASDVYASDAVRLDAAGRERVSRFVDQVAAGGGTNISAGLTEALRLLSHMSGARRLVLISDGQPTVGDVTPAGLAALVDRIHAADASVTALGVGYDYDARLMQTLADRGGGLSGSLDDAARLSEVLSLELAQARTVAARNVGLVLTPGPGVTIEDVPGRLSERSGDSVTVPLRDLRPGDGAVVWARVRTQVSGDQALLLSATVQWTSAMGQRLANAAGLALPVVASQQAFDSSRNEVRFAAGVRALGSTRIVAAADALARGDNEGAVSLLQAARNIFGMSADALAGEADETRKMEVRARSAKGDAARAEAHGLERKAMVNFARESDGY